MSKLQIVRIILNAAGVFIGAITASGTIGGAHGGIILAGLAATSLALRSIEAQLPTVGNPPYVPPAGDAAPPPSA